MTKTELTNAIRDVILAGATATSRGLLRSDMLLAAY